MTGKTSRPRAGAGGAAGRSASGDDLPRVELYTDGACSGNPGPGGWAYILLHPASGKSREESGAEPETTNNRMEMTAVIEGLGALSRRTRVELWSDSKYVLDGLKDWLPGWKKRGWKTADKKPVKNQDLWERLDGLVQGHELSYHWVKGHSEHPQNERCDRLAVEAIERLTGRTFVQDYHLRP
jgi:ribonuclease HI